MDPYGELVEELILEYQDGKIGNDCAGVTYVHSPSGTTFRVAEPYDKYLTTSRRGAEYAFNEFLDIVLEDLDPENLAPDHNGTPRTGQREVLEEVLDCVEHSNDPDWHAFFVEEWSDEVPTVPEGTGPGQLRAFIRGWLTGIGVTPYSAAEAANRASAWATYRRQVAELDGDGGVLVS